MSGMKKSLAVAFAALLASAAVSVARAQDGRDPAAVVARVGDATVTEQEVSLAKEAFADELANVPEAQQRSVVVDAVINMKLLAQGAHGAGLDQGPEYEARVDFLRLQAMRNVYVEHEVVKKLTDAELQDAYQKLVVSQHTPEEQVHARHILVETKEEAEKIISDLKVGASFEELAQQSKDPSGQNGGDLGFFGKGQMVPPFEAAAFVLQPGEVTQEPVQSEYGWHVIKVEEKRMSEPPSFDDVQEQLRSYVLRQNFERIMAELREKYTVEIVDPTALPPEPDSADEDDSDIDDEDLMNDLESDEDIDMDDDTGSDEDMNGAVSDDDVEMEDTAPESDPEAEGQAN